MADEKVEKKECPLCEGDGRDWHLLTGLGVLDCPVCEGEGEVKHDFKQPEL